MSDPEATPPSAAEIAAAEEIMGRVALANAVKVAAVMPDLRAVIADEAFGRLLGAVAVIRDRLPVGTPFHTHLGAMIVGMTNLRNDAALA